MSAPILAVRSLEKRHDRNGRSFHVVGDVSFTLAPGETLAVLGPNGCGKSTLLRILAGLDDATSGQIECELRRPGPELGYMPQNETLLPWRTISDNVRLPLEVAGHSRGASEAAVKVLLDEVGLSRFRAARPGILSGGMRQRALLARLFAGSPRLLLLDEPFGELDLVARRDFSVLLRRYVKEKSAVAVVVTHSAEEALSVADKVIVLSARPSRVVREISFAAGESVEGRLSALPEVVTSMISVMAENRL